MKPFNSKVAAFVCFLILFLGIIFSPTATASASRSFRLKKSEVAFQEMHFQDEIDSTSYGGSIEFDDSATRRIDLENTDYGGTGANDRHDPKSPGRA